MDENGGGFRTYFIVNKERHYKGKKMKRAKFIAFMSLFIFLCFLYGFKRQQETKELLEHEVTVELVVVEVFVTDKEGNFIDSLTKDDFEIYEDGKRVDIQYFAVVTPERKILKEEKPVTVKPRKQPLTPMKMKLVILFDGLNTNRFYLNAQWFQFEEMFKVLSGQVEEAMILELNRKTGVKIIQPFTSDQKLLNDKISEVSNAFWKETDEAVRENLIRDMYSLIYGGFLSSSSALFIIESLKKEDGLIRRTRLADSFSTFMAAVNYIRQFEGIKAVLIISDGFHLEKDIVRIFDPFKLFGGKQYFDQREAFEKFLQLINEEKLVFYALSPKGLRPDFSVASPVDYFSKRGQMFKDELAQWTKDRYTLQEIADETGGMYLRGQKKFENFAKELGRDLTHFYDISYIPSKKRKKGYHRIDVRVKRPGLIIRHKKGYSDFTDEEIEKRRLASAFLSPSLFKDIAFSCKTDFIALRGGYLQFWIRMKIPLDQFRKDSALVPLGEMALLFGINEWSKNKVHTGGRKLRIEEAINRNLNTLYRAYITSLINLEPGDYEARLILKQSDDRIGGWEASVRIPDVKEEKSLNLFNTICGFLREEEKENAVPFSVSIGDGSLLLSRYKFYPFVENVFAQGRQGALLLQICNPEEVKDLSLQFSLLNDKNIPLDVSSESVESYFDEELKISTEVYLLDFQKIPPADYHLNIKSADGRVEKTVEIKVVS